MKEEKKLFNVNKDVECLLCKNKGAIQSYGSYYPIGMGEDVSPFYEKHKDTPYLRRTHSLGGVIPYECLNCGNKGFIDSNFGGMEGYQMAFKSFR